MKICTEYSTTRWAVRQTDRQTDEQSEEKNGIDLGFWEPDFWRYLASGPGLKEKYTCSSYPLNYAHSATNLLTCEWEVCPSDLDTGGC